MLYQVKVSKSSDSRKRKPWIVRWREQNGTRPQVSFPNKAQAERFAVRKFNEINSEYYESTTSIAWHELQEKYLEARRADGIKENTIELYRITLDQFGKLTSHPETRVIDIRTIDHWKKQIKPKVTGMTLNSKLRYLSTLFNWAVKRKYLKKNPIDDSAKVPTETKIIPIWDIDQFKKALDVARVLEQGNQWQLIMLLALNGVGRKTALSNLSLDNIDFENNYILLKDKGSKENATPLHPFVMNKLTEYVAQMPEGQVRLFTSKFHRSTWQLLVGKAKLPYMRFHDIRSCGTTYLKGCGFSSSVTALVYNHSPQVSDKHYSKLDNFNFKQQAIEKLPL